MDALILRGKKIKRNFRHSFKSYERFSISRNVRIFCNERGIFLFHHRFTIVSFSFFFPFTCISLIFDAWVSNGLKGREDFYRFFISLPRTLQLEYPSILMKV